MGALFNLFEKGLYLSLLFAFFLSSFRSLLNLSAYVLRCLTIYASFWASYWRFYAAGSTLGESLRFNEFASVLETYPSAVFLFYLLFIERDLCRLCGVVILLRFYNGEEATKLWFEILLADLGEKRPPALGLIYSTIMRAYGNTTASLWTALFAVIALYTRYFFIGSSEIYCSSWESCYSFILRSI